MASRTTREFRLKSSRAPYTRGGIRFASNRQPLALNGGEISDDQLRRLAADPAITIDVVDAKSGEAVIHALDDGSLIGSAEAIAAEAEAQAKAEAKSRAAADKAAADKVKADAKATADAARKAAASAPKTGDA